MAVRLIKKSWWVDFRFNHTRYRKRSPENSRAGTQAYEAVLRQKLVRGESVDQVERAKQDPLFEQFAWLYIFCRQKLFRNDTKRMITALWPNGKPAAGQASCGAGTCSGDPKKK